MQWVNAAIQGILVGGLYALFATGLSLAFGVMRFVNLAHGDLAILAAYLVLSVSAVFGIGYWASLVLVIVIMAAVGYVAQRGLFDFTLGEDPLPGILVSFGVGIVIRTRSNSTTRPPTGRSTSARSSRSRSPSTTTSRSAGSRCSP